MELYEINMLEVIQRHERISQRDISNQVGISLGMVNLLIKKFIKVGLVKAERMDGNKARYVLTPNGLAYLSKKTVDYVSRSYQAVLKIRNHLSEIIERAYESEEIVYIYGKRDEVCAILIDLLEERGMTYVFLPEEGEGGALSRPEKYVQWQGIHEGGIYLLSEIGIGAAYE